MPIITYQYLGTFENLVIQTKVCFSEHEASIELEHLVAEYLKVPMEDTVDYIVPYWIDGSIKLHCEEVSSVH